MTDKIIPRDALRGITFPRLAGIDNETTGEEIQSVYDKWGSTYEEDMKNTGFVAAVIDSVKMFSQLLVKHNFNKNAYILDVGAGTGSGGLQLNNLGYTHIDGIDISSKMLEIAKEKKIYQNLICAAVDKKATGIADDTYDAQISIGCIGIGHAKPEALIEMARIAKPGGLVSFTILPYVWEDNVSGYTEVVNSLVEKGVWDIVSKDKIDSLVSDQIGPDHKWRYYYLITCQKKA